MWVLSFRGQFWKCWKLCRLGIRVFCICEMTTSLRGPWMWRLEWEMPHHGIMYWNILSPVGGLLVETVQPLECGASLEEVSLGMGLWGLITLLDFLFSLCLWCVDEIWLSVISCFRINRPASHSYCHVFPAMMDGVCSEVVTQNKLSSSKLLWVVFRNIKMNYTLVIKVNLITLPHLSSLVAVVELGPAHHHYGSRFGLSWHWVVPTWERMPRWGEDMWGWENWSAPNANP